MALEAMSLGDRCYVEEDYDAAIEHYTKAIQDAPSAKAYEARAKTHIQIEKYIEAVDDAGKAIDLDPTLASAYLRKGIASFKLDEYETARDCFSKGLELAPTNNNFKTWIRKCDAELADEAEAAAPQAAAPAVSKPTPAAPAPAAAGPVPSTAAEPAPAAAPAADSAPLAPAAAPEQQAKYRHQHYQIQDKVVVDVYAKNTPKERVSVSFQPRHLHVVIKDAEGQVEYELDRQLYADVAVEACRYDVSRAKIEISMKKADSTKAWPTLEPSNKAAAPNYSEPDTPPVGGQYPSSYVKAPRDWSKVEAEVKQMEDKGELDEGDPLNNFFKKIFAGGDEDTRRAMMKSFVESNGTVLSTNWTEVGSKKVEYTPPAGAEEKKL